MKILLGGSGPRAQGCESNILVYSSPQKFQMKLILAVKVWVSPPYIFIVLSCKQNIIHSSQPPTRIFLKAKSQKGTTKVTLYEPPNITFLIHHCCYLSKKQKQELHGSTMTFPRCGLESHVSN